MSSVNAEEDQKWVPTNVQVTVLRGRGLRGKGKHGTSDVYTIIQLGKEKYSTCVAEKTTEPEWREECSFELQPGVLEENGGRSGYTAGSSELVLIVMHRALIGMDVFLGQAVIQLDKVFRDSRGVKNEWYRLNSKTGKKEKERGDIQVSVQFTRNNLTASMYDLVMKDKTVSTFSKLKERMKGKRRSSDEDSSSAVLPSGYGSLYRMRQRLPSDGGGEEDYEDDEGGEVRRSKMRNFFLRGKLRKSSDTRSSTSLGSESSESSSRGGSLSPTAGISVVVSDLSNSPSNSSNLTVDNSPEHTANTSPKLSSPKCEFGDEAGEITITVPQPSLRVNGSHAYNVHALHPGSGKPAGSLGLGLLPKSLPLSMSLQNLSPRVSPDLPKGPVGDGRRWSFDKPGEEEKAAIAAALEQSGPMKCEEEERLGLAAVPQPSSTVESESQGKKQRKNLFSHGRSESAGKGQSQSKDESEQASAPSEEKHKGWFGSKDSHSKPSLVVSPNLKPSTDSHPPLLPPSHHPSGLPAPSVDSDTLASPLHHTNPFCHSQDISPPISPCNPFFSLLQHNPFYGDMLTDQTLKPLLPPLPYLSSSRPPITQLFPQRSNANPALPQVSLTTEDSIVDTDEKSKVEQRPLPPIPTEQENLLDKKSSNPFTSAGAAELDAEWDESFEAFAAGRLQSPEALSSDYKTKKNTSTVQPLEHCNNKGALLSTEDANQTTNVNDALPLPPKNTHTESLSEANKDTDHLDTFVQFLDAIIEPKILDDHNKMLHNSADSPKLNACIEGNQTNSTTNSVVLRTKMHQTPGHISSVCQSVNLNSSSPNPGSSGVGSLAEEDFLSCFSSFSTSEKFSASSPDDTEAQNFENSILCICEKSSEPTVVKNVKSSESEDNITDGSNDLSVGQDADKKVDSNDSNGLLIQPSPVPTQQPMIDTGETRTEDANSQTSSLSSDPHPELQLNHSSQSGLQPKPLVLQSDNENRDKSICDINGAIMGFSESKNPDDEPGSTHPSFHILTSSPDDRHCLSAPFDNTSLGGHDASKPSIFGDFLSASPGPGFDDSFLQSLNESTDSQHYQTCLSHLSSKCSNASEPTKTSHSDNSMLCGEETYNMRQIQLGAGLNQEGSNNDGINQNDRVEESICGCEDRAATVEPSFMIGDDFGLQILPTAPMDSYTDCHPKNLSEEFGDNQHVILDDSKCPESQHATLQRSQSEGTFRTAFEDLLMPSFGSDPGVTQESSSALPGPHLPPLASFAPSLTTEISSPLALCSLLSLADVSATSTAQTIAPALANAKPMTDAPHAVLPQEKQQQAANQQNSPHPVKPLTTATLAEEKRTEGRSVLATGLEKLKSTIHPGRSSQLTEQETDKKKCLTEGAGSYYHLTHSELVALLVQREAELARQKAEFERQGTLLVKRELELKKLKPQIKDLEDYIDTLLVRIMEQKPTLLQVRSKFK